MGWDSSRPVPWQRLMREWVIYVGIMAVIFLLLFRDSGVAGALAGLLISGPLYLGIGFVLAKFGYQRKSLKEMRTPRATPEESDDSSSSGSGSSSSSRSRPAPTSRTSTGINRKKAKPRKK